MAKGIKRLVNVAYESATAEIQAHASRGGKYAHGLASEGYNGGYRDALADVLLALNGVTPSRNGWWQRRSVDRTTTKGNT
jgi:hypothetical protein